MNLNIRKTTHLNIGETFSVFQQCNRTRTEITLILLEKRDVSTNTSPKKEHLYD